MKRFLSASGLRFVTSFLLFIAFILALSGLGVNDWEKIEISVIKSGEGGAKVPHHSVLEDKSILNHPFFRLRDGTRDEKDVEIVEEMTVWVGLLKVRMKLDKFVFEATYADVRAMSKSVEISIYDYAGRFSFGCLMFAVGGLVSAVVLSVMASLQKRRSTKVAASIACFVAGILMILSVVFWTRLKPNHLVDEDMLEEKKKSYQMAYYCPIIGGILALICSVVIIFWPTDDPWFEREQNTSRVKVRVRQFIRQADFGILPAIAMLLVIVAGMVLLTSIVLIDFEEQYYTQPNPYSSEEEKPNDLTLVGVFIGLTKIRVEQQKFVFETSLSEMQDFVEVGMPGVDQGKIKKIMKKFEDAGNGALVLFVAGLIGMMVYVVGIVALSVWERPKKLRITVSILSVLNSLVILLGCLVWLVARPDDYIVLYPNWVPEKEVRYGGNSWFLAISSAVLVLVSGLFLVFSRQDYQRLHLDSGDDEIQVFLGEDDEEEGEDVGSFIRPGSSTLSGPGAPEETSQDSDLRVRASS
eukprot:TRINITY_DN82292_c0_g1_i1.p1 TRINITY_DN82292_c0_g1~~TRINITY_DN82292_c0_g1_i1.p1  ORF type:complete len:525 (-),score=147.55 TRINITY_DN82292_c0_g1_i1:337-1911(-)